ncbi:tRNA pseudouridine(38-40) synthase TruA [Sulfuricaulis sp.]|jgi:tRNA pseudouridine38-40 synthase|uniref:tRNA pseudouridine(38-40) synthase TruA n=1 Tax=Sulfuricaulis sp. TaxID=2003553 RepID=UPI00355A5D4D
MRIAAILEYDGSRFSGWQRQDHARTVQGVVEEALSKVADEVIQVTVAGRTDAGVHAAGQVIHFDTSAARSDYSWVRGANSNLPYEVALLWAGPVEDGFHARYSATGRHYHYIILNRPIRPTYLAQRVTHEYRLLDEVAMQDASHYLLGEHDFTSFRATECQAKSPVRELRALDVARHGDMVHIHAHANAFLQHMVRNIAGVLMTVGAGEREPSWAKEVLEARDRRAGGVTAAPDGLYLREIEYPETFKLPRLSRAVGLW